MAFGLVKFGTYISVFQYSVTRPAELIDEITAFIGSLAGEVVV